MQIRNVPDGLHRKLKSRAADAGQTLSDYLLAELERLAARPTPDEMLARIHSRPRVKLKTPAAVSSARNVSRRDRRRRLRPAGVSPANAARHSRRGAPVSR
jgi:plasmid stability protein